MNEAANIITDEALKVLDEVKALPNVQLTRYISQTTKINEGFIEKTLIRLGKTGIIARNDLYTQLSAAFPLDRETSLALWVYMELHEEGKTQYRKAKMPAKLMFTNRDDSKLYRITVCSNPKYDKNVLALREVDEDPLFIEGCTEIIVSPVALSEVNTEPFPKRGCIFAHVAGDVFTEVPSINFERIGPST